MARLFGIIKVTVILALDFFVINHLFHSTDIAALITGIVAVYVFFGGYIDLLRDGAVKSTKLSSIDSARLNAVKNLIIPRVKKASSVNISRLKLYVVPDDDMNATAYGSNCVSFTRGSLNNMDTATLASVLGHEVSHLLNFDAEFNRAVFASITLILGCLSVLSFAVMLFIFLAFLLIGAFGSFFGFIAFRGATKLSGGLIRMVQRLIVIVYRTVLGIVSRGAEYRCDRYAFELGYGIQLSYFLSVTASSDQRYIKLSDAIYRSHPPTVKRIARLERLLNSSRAVV